MSRRLANVRYFLSPPCVGDNSVVADGRARGFASAEGVHAIVGAPIAKAASASVNAIGACFVATACLVGDPCVHELAALLACIGQQPGRYTEVAR